MKKIFILIAFIAIFLSNNFEASAQGRSTVKISVVDSLSKEPVGFVTVMLLPKGDTVSKYYTTTDIDGKAVIEKVKAGEYTVKTDLLGYQPYTKPVKVEKSTEDFGQILLKEDVVMLEGASISAVGNVITIKQDTVEYNASAFKVNDNAMLIDLLKKLPGIEVEDDGTVKAHGETINQIKINGKSFFLNDPDIAKENIPAKVVEKVKVIDKKSDQAIFSGIEDGENEKIIDISTYKGMFDGWFGNFTGGMGSDIRSAAAADSKFQQDNDMRYSGNALLARFSEDQQIAFIGNGNNTNTGGYGRRGGAFGMGGGGGITNQWGGGVSYTTTKKEHLEATLSANVNGSDSDSQRISERTTFRKDEDNMYTSSDSKTLSDSRTLGVSAEIKYNPDRIRLNITPSLSFSKGTNRGSNSNVTQSGEEGAAPDLYELLNDDVSYSYGVNTSRSGSGRFMFGTRVGQKAGRTISVQGNFSLSDSDRDSKEFSFTNYYANDSVRAIDQYSHTDSKNVSYNANLSYTEPLTEYMFLTFSYQYSYSRNKSVQNTFDYNGSAAHQMMSNLMDMTDAFIWNLDDISYYDLPNSYYSSTIDNLYINQTAGANLQFQKDRNFVQIGANLQPTYNETKTVKFNENSFIPGEWLLNWAPSVRARYNISRTKFLNARYSGRSSQPQTNRMLPILDVSSPTSISTGNAYLLPSFNHSASLDYTSNNVRTYSFFRVGVSGGYNIRNIVTASWYDADGVRYSVPVNSGKPSENLSTYISFNTPIAKSSFSFSTNTNVGMNLATSYQNTTSRGGVNAAEFDYDSFMEEFWGDSNGNRFYSGESGFGESKTTNYNVSESVDLRYNGDRFTSTISGSVRYNNSQYSLNSAANKSTWNNSVSASVMWEIFKDFKFDSDASYRFYHGYTGTGFNDPQLIWNAGFNWRIKSFTVAARAYDLLEQSKNIARTATENYISDSWSNQLGRYFLVSLTYTFGKFAGRNGGWGGFGGGWGGGRGGFGGFGGGWGGGRGGF